MERKQEEQARKVKELQSHVERLQRENDQLRTQIKESRDPGKGIINKYFFKALSFNLCNSPFTKVHMRLPTGWHFLKDQMVALSLLALIKDQM